MAEEQQQIKCHEDCPVHKLFTHNTCVKCKNYKDSPYYRETFKKIKKEGKIG